MDRLDGPVSGQRIWQVLTQGKDRQGEKIGIPLQDKFLRLMYELKNRTAFSLRGLSSQAAPFYPIQKCLSIDMAPDKGKAAPCLINLILQ
jgi:hypothetical protein